MREYFSRITPRGFNVYMTMTNEVPFIQIVGITKRFPGVTALDDVSFNIERGEVHALLGENGAGKSTLIKLLTGVYQPNDGKFLLNGQQVHLANPHQALVMGISAIYQDPCLVPSLSVEDNILLGREPNGKLPWFISQQKVHENAEKVLSQLGLNLNLRSKVDDLSPGQQQLVAIAKALSIDAQLIIMDEPTAALTEDEVNYLFNVIQDLRNRGISIIYVTHRIEEVFVIADRTTVLRDGNYIGTRSTSKTNKDELTKMIVGRTIEVDFLKRHPPSDEVVLKVEDISRGRDFQNISFSVKRGEIVALAGLIGSGRTDVIRSIFGAEPIQSGSIEIFGKIITPHKPSQAIHEGIFMVPEDRKAQAIHTQLSVQSNITLANLQEYTRTGIIQTKQEGISVGEHIQRLHIVPPDPEKKVQNLSGGNQQKVVLAKALDTDAEILFLDEPTAGIDIGAKAEIRSLINQLADQGKTVVLVSSDIHDVLELANRVLVMREGKLVGEIMRSDATSENIMHMAMTGEDQ